MGGVGKVKSGKRLRLCRCRLSSKSLSVSPLSAVASRRLFTSCDGLARCNKWPAAGESRLRQKRDAEPFLLRRARHFLRRRQQCPSPLQEGSARCLSPRLHIIHAERTADGMPTHRISRAERAWPYRKPSTLFFATAHSLPASPIPFALPPFPPCGRPTD